MLIGITGKAGAGKDTVAEYLWHRHRFTRIAFADPMKRAAQEIFGLSDEETWSRELKEVELPYWGMSPRRMFQLLGTEAMQGTFGREVWLKRWMLSYNIVKDSDHVVVPDVRFNVEADMLKGYGALIIRVVRGAESGLENSAQAHASEVGIADGYVAHTIHNNGTFDDLFSSIDDFLGTRGLK